MPRLISKPAAPPPLPANDALVEQLATHSITSPRLRGEAGIRALACGFRVRGKARTYIPQRPSPRPPPRNRGEGESDPIRERSAVSLKGKVAIVTGGIARVVGFVAGEGASYLAATTIFADGGIMHNSVGL
jgi:hypothetical protein